MTQTLTTSQLDQLAQQLDDVRLRTRAHLGAADASYIRRLIRCQRGCEITGRLLLISILWSPWSWLLGVLLLALAKILDNMEIGHNVMHGQYDWMNDPNISSRHYEWDNVGDAASWKRYHNYEHHTYTNIIGKDRDFGYGLLRLSDDFAWRAKNRWQLLIYTALSVLFEWGVAYHELAGRRVFSRRKKPCANTPGVSDEALKQAFFSKISKQVFKDYVFFPLLCLPVFWSVLLGNLLANVIRNLWTSTIIFCGHFTEEVHTFLAHDCEQESRGQWYYRQIQGSSNITGPRWFHILTGHLSCQIEHHLFPDIPAWRYPDMAPEVEAICQQYGIGYNSGSFWQQYATVLKRIYHYSKPPKPIVP